MNDKEDDKKIGLAKALGKVLETVEDEGYCEGWDVAFSLGRSSGSTNAAYEFVDWLVSAYDKTLAKLGPAKKNWAEFDENFNLWLKNFEELLPFEIDWTNKVPVFSEDDEVPIFVDDFDDDDDEDEDDDEDDEE